MDEVTLVGFVAVVVGLPVSGLLAGGLGFLLVEWPEVVVVVVVGSTTRSYRAVTVLLRRPS